MKTTLFTALGLLAATSFAQNSAPMTSRVMIREEYRNTDMLPEGNFERASYIKAKIDKLATMVSGSEADALRRIASFFNDPATTEIYTGLYNNWVRSKQLRTEMAFRNLTPEYRASVTMDGYTMLGDEQGRALRMVAESPSQNIDYREAYRLLSADLIDSHKPLVLDAFWSASERDKDAIVSILRGFAMDAKRPVYASTLFSRTYGM